MELGRDVCTLVGFEDLTDVFYGHAGDVLEEGDEGDEVVCAGGCTGAVPFGKGDCIFGLELGVGGYGVNNECFGEVAVEVGEVLRRVSGRKPWDEIRLPLRVHRSYIWLLL